MYIYTYVYTGAPSGHHNPPGGARRPVTSRWVAAPPYFRCAPSEHQNPFGGASQPVPSRWFVAPPYFIRSVSLSSLEMIVDQDWRREACLPAPPPRFGCRRVDQPAPFSGYEPA